MALRFLAVFLLLAALPHSTEVLADPPTDKQWEPIQELTDEFGDSFDFEKWTSWNPTWLGSQPALFAPWNVAVADGELHLTAKLEDIPYYHAQWYHTYTTAAVKSRNRVKYGYFEIRAKPMNASVSSAFWFYDRTPTAWTELDVFEITGNSSLHPEWTDYVAYFNARVFALEGTGATEQLPMTNGGFWWASHRLADEYHVYALEWDEKEIKWYVDGVVHKTLDNRYWHQPIYMNFDAETHYSIGLPEASELPSIYKIDYVRSWARKETAASSISPEETSGTEPLDSQDPIAATNDSFEVLEGSSANSFDVLANDTAGGAGSPLTVTMLGTPSHGGSVSISDNQISYVPVADFDGIETFEYTVSDGTFNAAATVTVTVTRVDSPSAVDDSDTSDSPADDIAEPGSSTDSTNVDANTDDDVVPDDIESPTIIGTETPGQDRSGEAPTVVPAVPALVTESPVDTLSQSNENNSEVPVDSGGPGSAPATVSAPPASAPPASATPSPPAGGSGGASSPALLLVFLAVALRRRHPAA